MDKKELASILKGKGIWATTGVDQPVRNFISTGSVALDWAISGKLLGGGLPSGRVVDFFGDPSTGKSLLIQHILKNTQNLGGIAILDDVEQAYDMFFAKAIGVKVEDLWIISSETVEEHFKAVAKIIASIREKDKDVLITIALDSLAALSTKHEKDVGFDKVDMFKAKLIRQGMRVLGGSFSKENVLYVVANHVIANIGAMYGPKSTTPGGGGVPFQASVRVELNLRGQLEAENKKKVGVKVRANIRKNRVAPPFKQVVFDVFFDRGVEGYSGMFDVLVEEGIIKSAGGWFEYDGKKHRREDLEKDMKNIVAIEYSALSPKEGV